MNTLPFEIIAVIIISLYYFGMLIYHIWADTIGPCAPTDLFCTQDCQCLAGNCINGKCTSLEDVITPKSVISTSWKHALDNDA